MSIPRTFSPMNSLAFQCKKAVSYVRGYSIGYWGTAFYYIDNAQDMYIKGGELQGRLYDVVGKHQARGLHTIHFLEPVRAPQNSSHLLSGTDLIYTSEETDLHAIYGLSNLDMSHVEDASAMFANDTLIKALDLAHWDVHHVQDFSYMFYGMSNLTTLPVASWNTTHAIKMRAMFSNVTRLKKLELTCWRTQYVRDMAWMFAGMSNLLSLDMSILDMSQVQDTNAMFLWMNSDVRLKLNPTLHFTHSSGINYEHVKIASDS